MQVHFILKLNWKHFINTLMFQFTWNKSMSVNCAMKNRFRNGILECWQNELNEKS